MECISQIIFDFYHFSKILAYILSKNWLLADLHVEIENAFENDQDLFEVLIKICHFSLVACWSI